MFMNPTVTIAIPTYNESIHIESIINGFISQKYANLLEVLVADGGSTDGTQDIVRRIASQNPQVKLLHNPKRLQCHALNIMLQEARGEVFLRADSHCVYDENYIQACVLNLLSSKALNVGGCQRFIAKTAFQSGVALASRSILGNGGAKYRDPNYSGYAETVFLGCFWRDKLIEVGGYYIHATSNEDAELNLRLLQNNVQAVYVSSEIRVWYYPRKDIKGLWIQYFRYGRGRYITSVRHRGRSPLRTKVPFLLLSALLITSLMLYGKFGLLFGSIPTLIIGLSLAIESIRLTVKYRKDFSKIIWRGDSESCPSPLLTCFCCWIALLTMPFSHSLGTIFQAFRHRLLKVEGW
jgi:glycosyltransferase involved in cell wall biosynthesis